MKVLLIRLGGLGDVVHAMPALQDIRLAHSAVTIDWVALPRFAPLVRKVDGVAEVIEAPPHEARQMLWSGRVRSDFAALRKRLARDAYDAVLDLQGVQQSALIARLARLAPGGHRYGLGNPTEGSPWDRSARWLVDRPIQVESRVHALDRSRRLASGALRHSIQSAPRFGLHAGRRASGLRMAPTIAFLHGSSHDDRLWPQANWVALGKRFLHEGWRIALPQGGELDQMRAELIAAALQFERDPRVEVWPTLALAAVVDRLGAVQGAIGVDGGLSHIAVALNLPHVQIFNSQASWRTGPQPEHGHRWQRSLEGRPTLEAVWNAWHTVRAEAARAALP